MIRAFTFISLIFFGSNSLAIQRDGNWLIDICTPITKHRDLITGELKPNRPTTISNEDAYKINICLSYIDGIAVSHFFTGRQKGNKPHVCAYKAGYNENLAAIAVMSTLIRAISIENSKDFFKMPAAGIVTQVLQGNYPCK